VTDVGHWRAAIFALGFGLYHAVIGLINFANYEKPIPAAIALFLYTAVLILVTRFRDDLRLPNAVTFGVAVAASAILILTLYAIGEVSNYPNQLWFVVGIGSIMGILAYRNRAVVAWIGTIALVSSLLVWGGVEVLAASGVAGSLALVAGSQGAAMALKSAQKSSSAFLQLRLASNLASEDLTIRRAGSQLRLKTALDSSLPLLRMIQEKEGNITSSDAKKLLLSEAGIRDQIRAQGFQDTQLIAAVFSARERGVEVQLADDGGIDLLDEEKKSRIFKVLAQTVSGAKAGKVVIRSVAGESWTVSLFASDPSATSEDVFLRL
jgi:hypothetical protein